MCANLWQTKMTGRWPTPAAVSWSISWPTVPHSGRDCPYGASKSPFVNIISMQSNSATTSS